MKKSIMIWMLGIAGMLASCSQDEVLNNSTDNGLSTVTITTTLEGGLKTRATHDADDNVERCLMEVRDTEGTLVGNQYVGIKLGDSYTFALTLPSGVHYNYLFWADDNASYTADDLTAISVAAGKQPGIAYYGKIENQALSQGMNVTLTHAVAKITLSTTGALDAGASATVNIPTYKGFNVSAAADAVVTGTSEATTFNCTHTEAIPADGGEVASFYILAPVSGDVSTATVTYSGQSSTLTNFPLRMNYRTLIKGDVANIGKISASISATLSNNWSDNEDQVFPLMITAENPLTQERIEKALANGNTTLVLKGDLTDNDFTTLNPFVVNDIKTLDMGECNTTEIPEDALWCDNKTIGISTLILPKGLIKIGDRSFYMTKFTSIDLPETLEAIGYNAISFGELTSITIPASVTEIEDYAFSRQTKMTTITFKGTTPPAVKRYAFPFSGVETVFVPAGCKEAYVALAANGLTEDNITELTPE